MRQRHSWAVSPGHGKYCHRISLLKCATVQKVFSLYQFTALTPNKQDLYRLWHQANISLLTS